MRSRKRVLAGPGKVFTELSPHSHRAPVPFPRPGLCVATTLALWVCKFFLLHLLNFP